MFKQMRAEQTGLLLRAEPDQGGQILTMLMLDTRGDVHLFGSFDTLSP